MTEQQQKQLLIADVNIQSAMLMQQAMLSKYVSLLYNGNERQRSEAYEEFMLACQKLADAHKAKVLIYGLDQI